jgi:co-chaperonin GroES (HSP10)
MIQYPHTKVEDARSIPTESLYEPFVPILDRILCRRVIEKQENGLTVPDKFRQHSHKMEVLAVGDGVFVGGKVHPMPVKPGDIVLGGEYNAERFVKDGEELWILRIQYVRGVERLKK